MSFLSFPSLVHPLVDEVWCPEGLQSDDLARQESAVKSKLESFARESAPLPVGVNPPNKRGGGEHDGLNDDDADRETASDNSDDMINDDGYFGSDNDDDDDEFDATWD